MVQPKITKGGKFVSAIDESGNPIVKFQEKTTTLKYDLTFRTWKLASKTFKLISVEEHSPKFRKKISFSIIWKRNLQIKGTVPYGLGAVKEYEYLTRKVTVSVKPDFWSIFLFCETFGVAKRKMSNVVMRDFFNSHGYGSGSIIGYSKTPAGHPLRVTEYKWRTISEDEANKLYSSGKALLVGRVVEKDGITTYSFGGTLKT